MILCFFCISSELCTFVFKFRLFCPADRKTTVYPIDVININNLAQTKTDKMKRKDDDGITSTDDDTKEDDDVADP